jgi:lipoprotein NlpD
MRFKIISLILCFFAISCATRTTPAPVENATKAPSYLDMTKPAAAPKPVDKSNNVEQAASMSSLSDDNTSIKQVSNPKPLVAPTSPKQVDAAAAPIAVAPATTSADGFIMPTTGQTDGYKASNKGIDIYGTLGQDINAANSGKVVYSGNGLKDYGNLIIIKHSDVYLTAYAHNKVNLVKEGATVKRGQKIAKMGQGDSNKAVLHFELRKNGKPVDPFTLIPKGN